MTTQEYIMNKYNVNEDGLRITLNIKRRDMVILFRELGFKYGAEIGVDKGNFSEELCLGIPGLKLYCIDPWMGDYESHMEEAVKRLAPYNCEIIRKTSMEAIKEFAPGDLDFVYIDGDHSYDRVLEDLNGWTNIVREDGIISGHDYLNVKFIHRRMWVRKAVNNYLEQHPIIDKFFMAHKNSQSSWFFVNP
jgi:predicted O-methyltransferase YrrM